MKKTTVRLLHERTAELAIGASTLRNQGARGVVANARDFLKELDVGSFRVKDPRLFRSRLNVATRRLRERLPRRARHWGSARKALNIFLRDVLYNHYWSSPDFVDTLRRGIMASEGVHDGQASAAS